VLFRSSALPDASLTSTLYNLVQQLVDDSNNPFEEEVVSSVAQRKEKIEFLLYTGLTRWMKTFKPLKWQYRRILWPVVAPSEISNNVRCDDSSSIASNSVSGSVTTAASAFSTMPPKSSPARTSTAGAAVVMSLENIIEELELNPETRMHACCLVTFYFTHAIPTMSQKEALEFVKTFGAYMNLSETLSVASRLHLEEVIEVLLDMATKYDVMHKKAKVEFDVINTGLAMCQQPPLSVLVQYLNERTLENSAVLPFLISAYPDLQPWLVRKSAYAGDLESQKNYYEYLSTLLDPMYGYESARKDIDLVRDLCILSIISDAPECRSNFYSVARGNNKTFHRDIPVLLDLSMKIRDYGLSLSLGRFL